MSKWQATCQLHSEVFKTREDHYNHAVWPVTYHGPELTAQRGERKRAGRRAPGPSSGLQAHLHPPLWPTGPSPSLWPRAGAGQMELTSLAAVALSPSTVSLPHLLQLSFNSGIQSKPRRH